MFWPSNASPIGLLPDGRLTDPVTFAAFGSIRYTVSRPLHDRADIRVGRKNQRMSEPHPNRKLR